MTTETTTNDIPWADVAVLGISEDRAARAHWVDATPTRRHIHRLLAAGWTRPDIARDAGVRCEWIRFACSGQPERGRGLLQSIPATVSSRVRAIPVRPHGPQRRVTLTGTIRRLQGLAAAAWPTAHLASELGVDEQTVRRITEGRAATVDRGLAIAVAVLFETLHATRGTCAQTAAAARDAGYKAAFDWDIDDLDEVTVAALSGTAEVAAVDDTLLMRLLDNTAQGCRGIRIPTAERIGYAAAMLLRGHGTTAISRAMRVSGTTARALVDDAMQLARTADHATAAA